MSRQGLEETCEQEEPGSIQESLCRGKAEKIRGKNQGNKQGRNQMIIQKHASAFRPGRRSGTYRFMAAALLTGSLAAGMALPAGAVTLDWEDLTDAQQEQAYHQLESENQALREQLAQLQGGGTGQADGGQSSEGTGTDSGGGAATDQGTSQDASDAAAQAQSAQVKSKETFLADLAASFNARQEKARTYTNEEVSAMSEADMWDFRFACAAQERAFYDAYHAAQFDDLNILYLCSEYCLGLEKQYKAQEIWNAQADSDEANRLYTAGYYNRAYALVELCEFYGLDLASEYQNLKNAVSQMDAMSSDETRNASVDPKRVEQVQELLNSLGFLCGTPDGIAGRQTASCIERFQMMYGYEPADGIIDDELMTQLSEQLSRRQG